MIRVAFSLASSAVCLSMVSRSSLMSFACASTAVVKFSALSRWPSARRDSSLARAAALSAARSVQLCSLPLFSSLPWQRLPRMSSLRSVLVVYGQSAFAWRWFSLSSPPSPGSPRSIPLSRLVPSAATPHSTSSSFPQVTAADGRQCWCPHS